MNSGKLIDLTLTFNHTDFPSSIETYNVSLDIEGESYNAACYKFANDGMCGTYVDFPGHLVEFDDGTHAGNYPMEKLFMVPATFLRLNLQAGQREITIADLEAARTEIKGEMAILHALGDKNFYDYTPETIPYLKKETFEWFIGKGIRLFASDVYENKCSYEGIFPAFFKNRITCVCYPVNLQAISSTYLHACVVPLKVDNVVQLPCRFFVIEK